MQILREIRLSLMASGLVVTISLGCGDSAVLPEPIYLNVVDTATLYALRGTPVVLPSGYDVPTKLVTRTDVSVFDFAFDITTGGEPVIYPAGALRLTRQAAILKSSQSFETILSAPGTGFIDSLPVAVAPGVVFVVRSRPFISGCELIGQLPRYGKFRVLEVDAAARSVTLETLVNQNCGYRGLEPGTPTN